MTGTSGSSGCDQTDLVSAYCLHALPAAEMVSFETHMAGCTACQNELSLLRPVVESLTSWPIDSLHPSVALWDRLVERISDEPGKYHAPSQGQWSEPPWEDVAPGIACKLLATDLQRDRVSMLVRLAPGVEYPAHTHSGVEELHLLQGALWIDQRKLVAGDYYRAEPGTSDKRVWSETGCICFLLTSPSDELR
jgi:anti-sigma factor ChrR (cupin superfamily)